MDFLRYGPFNPCRAGVKNETFRTAVKKRNVSFLRDKGLKGFKGKKEKGNYNQIFVFPCSSFPLISSYYINSKTPVKSALP
jgi:hypothetical protein